MDFKLSCYLSQKPYIDLEFDFEHEKCLVEARTLSHNFKEHRSEATSKKQGGWKTLGLRTLGGDVQKTDAPECYGLKSVTSKDFKNTDFLLQCPTIKSMLEKYFILSESHRIRIMCLDPGAEILTHSDAPDSECSVGINIALNMPEGCSFFMDVNPDGSSHEFSEKVPFRAGTAMMLNIARYHRVINQSSKKRFHIIVHGPLRKNPIPNRLLGNLLDRVILRRVLVGKNPETSFFYEAWKKHGWFLEILPKDVEVVYLQGSTATEDLKRESLITTQALAIVPLVEISQKGVPVVEIKDLDQFLKSIGSEKKFVLLIGSGNYFHDRHKALLNIFKGLYKIKKEKAFIMGHILNINNQLPFFHHQYMWINLEMLRSLGMPRFNDQGHEKSFPPYTVSPENIHDDYTPLWIEEAKDGKCSVGSLGWGTQVIRVALENQKKIINVDISQRDEIRKFMYPEVDKHPYQEEIRESFKKASEGYSKTVFTFNTESTGSLEIPSFKPEKLVTLASGFKCIYLAHKLEPHQIEVIDQSHLALEYVKELSSCDDLNRLIQIIYDFSHGELSRDYINDRVALEIRGFFEDDELLFFSSLDQLRMANYTQVDVLKEPKRLSLILGDEKSFFWHSNLWLTDNALSRNTLVELQENYSSFLNGLSKKGEFIWKIPGKDVTIIGSSLEAPRIAVCGMPHLKYNPSDFKLFSSI